VEPANPDVAMNAPAPLPEQCVQWRRDDSMPRRQGEPSPQVCERFTRPDWGSVAAVGTDLFAAGLFPFEAISILLLVALVGAIAIARPLRPDDAGDAEAEDPGHSEGRAG